MPPPALQAVLPLWHEDRRALADEVLRLRLSGARRLRRRALARRELLRRRLRRGFIARLPAGVDACGENGEFHTFVYDGPRFARPVPHRVAAIHDVRIETPFAAHYHTAELAQA